MPSEYTKKRKEHLKERGIVQFTTYLEKDLNFDLEKYCEETGYSKKEAVNRLIRLGLRLIRSTQSTSKPGVVFGGE